MKNNHEIVKGLLKDIDEDLNIGNVEFKPEYYYHIVNEYGITEKLNNIIDEFPKNIEKESSVFKKIDLNIGIICDEFLYYSLKDSANFIYIPYSELLKVNIKIDVLMVVTSWRGVDNSWDHLANPNSKKREDLIELIREYKENSIPTIFYSKEDPVSYSEYLSIAKECDFIFTSAIEMVEVYKNDTNNSNVDYLEFGINSAYHNPIGKNLEDEYLSKQVTFAGSWMKRFPERNVSGLKIFEGVHKTDFDLCIIDRQYERKMERYHYPNFLLKNISATIPHNRLMRLHKATQWGINLNSVQDSKTMFANRIYELQAMGNIILSNYNRGVHLKFPNVKIVYNRDDVKDILNKTSLNEIKNLIAVGIRTVMLNHTSHHRVAKIARKIGFSYAVHTPRILVIGDSIEAKGSFERQNYKNLYYLDKNELKNLNDIPKNYDFIAEFSKGYYYGEYYIENLLSAFVYTDANIIKMDQNHYNYTNDDNLEIGNCLFKLKSYLDFSKYKTTEKIFNIPKTEFTILNNVTNGRQSDKVLTLFMFIDNDNVKTIEYKSIASLKHTMRYNEIDIALICKEQISKHNKIFLDRINNYQNVQVYNADYKSNFYDVINDLISNLETEYISILSGENEIIPHSYDQFINRMEQEVDTDIIIGKSIDYKSSMKQIFNFHDSFLAFDNEKACQLEALIIKTEFLEKNSLQFNSSTEYDSSFIVKLFKANPNTSNFSKIVHKNNIHFNFEKTDTPLDRLKRALVEERERKDLAEEESLLNSYINNVFPEILTSDYLVSFKKLDSKDKSEGWNILNSIINMYIDRYNYSNDKFNKVLEIIH